MDGRGRGARGGGARVEGVDATYAQYVTQEYTGLFEPDTRVRVRINNLVAYLETVQAGARVSDTGAVLIRAYYASRHGADARGAGPAATALRTLPPSLTAFATRNGGVLPRERLRQIIDGRGISSHGGRDMPVWGDAFKRTPGGLSEDAVKARIDAITEERSNLCCGRRLDALVSRHVG